MTVRLIKPAQQPLQRAAAWMDVTRPNRTAAWMDVTRPNRTLADDLALALDGWLGSDDIRLIQGCALLGQRLGRTLAERW